MKTTVISLLTLAALANLNALASVKQNFLSTEDSIYLDISIKTSSFIGESGKNSIGLYYTVNSPYANTLSCDLNFIVKDADFQNVAFDLIDETVYPEKAFGLNATNKVDPTLTQDANLKNGMVLTIQKAAHCHGFDMRVTMSHTTCLALTPNYANFCDKYVTTGSTYPVFIHDYFIGTCQCK